MLLRPIALLPFATSLLLGGCALGPDFTRPDVAIPATYLEAPKNWKIAEPRDQEAQTAWWEIFGDPQLNALVEEAGRSNHSLSAAEANYRQAQAATGSTRAGLFPALGSGISSVRSQNGGNTAIAATERITLNTAWELDVWGRIRRNVEASSNTAEATAGDLAATRLSIQATLVQNYFQLRINDAQQRLLERTLTVYRRSHEITRNRYEAGIASQADVAQAETQLHTTQAQLVDLGIQRAQLAHAIAALLGKLPGDLPMLASETALNIPEIPLELPSTLLERRPDVAAAERRVAAANAQIGAAQAAFFPSLSLTGNGGYQNGSFNDILQLPNRFWSLGPALAFTLFDAGARSAQKAQAIAAYDKSVANYRQTVLTAFQEVEDNLAALRILSEEKAIQKRAAEAAGNFQTLTNNQYLAGTVSFLNVATAQAAALNAERGSLDILNRQLLASVGLIKALGGDAWK